MKTAIIDNGIDEETIRLYQNESMQSIKHYIVKDGKVRISEPIQGRVTHGGLCARMFAKQAGRLPEISICLERDQEQFSNINDLVVALQWCLEHEVKLINLSIGTTSHKDGKLLFEVTHRLKESGCMIIAAASNEQCITYPAVYPTCIGVCTPKSTMLKEEELAYLEHPIDGINLVTYGISMPQYEMYPCNSYAAAYISGVYDKCISKELLNQGREFLWNEITIPVSEKWISDYYREKMNQTEEVESIIVVFQNLPSQNHLMDELYEKIEKENYSCCKISRDRMEVFQQEICFANCPLNKRELICFIGKVYRFDLILMEYSELSAEVADVLVVDSKYLQRKWHADLICSYDITSDELWDRIKDRYES